MMMFVIFLIVNVGTIGIFYGVYGTKRKYEEGMLWECICRVRRLKAKK